MMQHSGLSQFVEHIAAAAVTEPVLADTAAAAAEVEVVIDPVASLHNTIIITIIMRAKNTN